MEPLDKALGTQHKGLTLVNQEFYRIKKKTKPLCGHAPRGTNIQISRKMVETFKQCERKQKQEGIRRVYSQLQIWFSSSMGHHPLPLCPHLSCNRTIHAMATRPSSPQLQQDRPSSHRHTPIFSPDSAMSNIVNSSNP